LKLGTVEMRAKEILLALSERLAVGPRGVPDLGCAIIGTSETRQRIGREVVLHVTIEELREPHGRLGMFGAPVPRERGEVEIRPSPQQHERPEMFRVVPLRRCFHRAAHPSTRVTRRNCIRIPPRDLSSNPRLLGLEASRWKSGGHAPYEGV